MRLSCLECGNVYTTCDLQREDGLPEIIFLGESHNEPLSIVSREAIFAGAKNGNFPLVTEVGPNGPLPPWESMSSNIKGIESPVSYGVIRSYFLQRKLIDDTDPTIVLIIAGVVPYVARNPLFKMAYEDLRKDFKNVCVSCFAAIDKVIPDYLKDDKTVKVDKTVLQLLRSESSLNQIRFLRKLHFRIIEIAREKYGDRLPVEDLKPIETDMEAEKFGLYRGGNFYPGSSFFNLVENVRNRDFTGNIADSLCQLKGSTNYIVVLLGDDHVEGISKLLLQLSGGKLKLHHLRTWVSSDMATFERFKPKIQYLRKSKGS